MRAYIPLGISNFKILAIHRLCIAASFLCDIGPLRSFSNSMDQRLSSLRVQNYVVSAVRTASSRTNGPHSAQR